MFACFCVFCVGMIFEQKLFLSFWLTISLMRKFSSFFFYFVSVDFFLIRKPPSIRKQACRVFFVSFRILHVRCVSEIHEIPTSKQLYRADNIERLKPTRNESRSETEKMPNKSHALN